MNREKLETKLNRLYEILDTWRNEYKPMIERHIAIHQRQYVNNFGRAYVYKKEVKL